MRTYKRYYLNQCVIEIPNDITSVYFSIIKLPDIKVIGIFWQFYRSLNDINFYCSISKAKLDLRSFPITKYLE